MGVSIASHCARRVIHPTTGNIELQGRGGQTIVFREQDGAGAFIDISADILTFELAAVAGFAGAVIAMTPVTGDVTSQRIVIPASLVRTLPFNTAIPFAVVDSTADPWTPWSGQLRVYGYQATPA